MRRYDLNDFKGGWFIGDFEPSIVKTKDYECAVKRYRKGDFERAHVHRIATEITVIVEGSARMNGVEYHEGDVIVLSPGEATDFEALTDVVNVVVKFPSVIGDKYEVSTC